MPTVMMETATCKIYPSKQMQLCARILVQVTPLRPGAVPEDEWVLSKDLLLEETVCCSSRGLHRVLEKIGQATAPPKPRKAKKPVPTEQPTVTANA